MAPRPPPDGPLGGAKTNGGEVYLERERRLVAGMGPEAVVSYWCVLGFASIDLFAESDKKGWGWLVTSCDAEASVEVVNHRKDGRGTVQRIEVGGNEPHEWDDDDEEDAEPVDVLMPVAPGHGHVADMRSLGLFQQLRLVSTLSAQGGTIFRARHDGGVSWVSPYTGCLPLSPLRPEAWCK